MITVRKLKLTIINSDKNIRNEQYTFIRDAQYSQYKGLNKAINLLAVGFYNSGLDGLKEAQKSLTNSNPIFSEINFGKGIDSKSLITQRAKKDFSTDLKNGLAKGERTVRNYRRTFPLMSRGRDFKFYYEGEETYIKWVNSIVFKVILGVKVKNTLELRHTVHMIIDKKYKVKESSLYFDKRNNLILNLTLDIPETNKNQIIEGRTLGVDLGIAVPAYISLNDKSYVKKAIGSINEFLKVRTQMKSRRKRLSKQLQASRGGKGRKDKLKTLESFTEKERNFARTYNHFISKTIVKFAKDNKCEFINLEKLKKDGFPNKILESWSYFQLQNMIEYKADRVGIKVRYVDAEYTSQTCSVCGYIDKENRQSQSKFVCKNCGFTANADYNASQNISKSIDKRKNVRYNIVKEVVL